MASISEIIKKYNLSSLPGEGGFFRFISEFGNAGCIYYLITKDSFSSMHKLSDDEMWFFLEGGEAEQLIIDSNGKEEIRVLNQDNRDSLVKGGSWQGTRLLDGEYALFSTVMSPKYCDEMYLSANDDLFISHPKAKEFIN